MENHVAQTVLMQMLRTARSVGVTLRGTEKSNFKFSAAFTIDGKGSFILTADSCKPRLLKNAADIESIIRRACAKLETLSIDWQNAARFARSQKLADADAVQAAARVQALLPGAQARKAKAEAVIAKINAEWAAGEHKAVRLDDLAHEIAAADSIINAAQGALPNGGAVGTSDIYAGHPLTAADIAFFEDTKSGVQENIDSGWIAWLDGVGWVWSVPVANWVETGFAWWDSHVNTLDGDPDTFRPRMTFAMFRQYLRGGVDVGYDLEKLPCNGALIYRRDGDGNITGSRFNDDRTSGAIVLTGDTWDLAQ